MRVLSYVTMETKPGGFLWQNNHDLVPAVAWMATVGADPNVDFSPRARISAARLQNVNEGGARGARDLDAIVTQSSLMVDLCSVTNGELKDDEYHGHGTLTFADGRVQEGVWVENKFALAE